MHKYTLFILVWFLSFSINAQESEYTVVTCETCTEISSFKSVATTLGEGRYIVINLETSIAHYIEVSTTDGHLAASVKSLPEKELRDLEKFKELKNILEKVESNKESNSI
ncbi:hypothetical protein LJ739_08840 [Aestuariibacter halophilus]|uniref:Uncharacterized protein n=1 Tax=Fluctibacter halophilus TaxID=226011 RepID=A0ABS8G9E6_9ALTE|nr:hypothetical protein [Aestuariibacter halophilus]MCC2616344.1 hypothetical protein [Aestuariibacter halophilus]